MSIKFYYYFVLLYVVFCSSCASLTGYQDGRAVGEGNFELTGSVNASQSPDFDLFDSDNDSIDVTIPSFWFPNIELGGRYGVNNKLDITTKLNTNLNVSVGAKYQLIGDRFSKFAFGAGADFGTFGLISGLWNLQIPLYLSAHPTDNVTIYASPRFIHQFTSFTGGNLQYYGGNVGLLFGSKHKFGLDVGYYGLSDVSASLLTVGIGGKFLFSDDEDRQGAPDRPVNYKKSKKRKK